MDTQDFTDPSGAKIDRLAAVKQVLDEFLARRKGDRVGVVVFGDAPFTARAFHHRPRSLPPALLDEMVRSAWPARAPPSATRSASAVNLFDPARPCQASTIIALTDGNDTASKRAAGRGRPASRVTRRSPSTPSLSAIRRAAGEDKLDEAGTEGRRLGDRRRLLPRPRPRRSSRDIYNRLDADRDAQGSTRCASDRARSSSGCRCCAGAAPSMWWRRRVARLRAACAEPGSREAQST